MKRASGPRRNARSTTRAPHLRLERGEPGMSPPVSSPYGRRATDRAASIWVDSALREQILAALGERPELDGCELDVFAAAGDVIIIGTVPSFHAEQRALEVAARCAGVRSVATRMHLVLPGIPDSAEGIAGSPPINAEDATAETEEHV